MSLHVDHRPKTLDELVGNEHVKDSLGKVLLRKDPAHSYLFTGSPGTGKTTLARIIKNALQISNTNFYEYNAANTRGIDTIREITDNCQYLGIGENPRKLYLLDECFAYFTSVSTPQGLKMIEQIRPGDTIYNMSGEDKVVHVFKNKVPLNRVYKIELENGRTTYCSSDHLFFTPNGWVKAKYLLGFLTYSINGDRMLCIGSPRKEKVDAKNRILQRDGRKSMSNLLRNIFGWQKLARALKKENLLNELWGKAQESKPRVQSQDIQPPSPRESFKGCESVLRHTSLAVCEKEIIRTHEKEQPGKEPGCDRESKKHKTTERDTSCLCWHSWRKWASNSSPKIVSFCSWVAGRGRNQLWAENTREQAIPQKLQGGYWQSSTEDCDRSGWQGTSGEEAFRKRYKKDAKTNGLRVASVEVYQYGSNDRSFDCVIGHRERNQGYVEFYDLQVMNHPSYYANEMLVHNCHKLTNDAMNAMLKLLEEPPNHCYFVLCTAEIETVKPTIKNAIKRRCHEYEMSPLKPNEMLQLLKTVLRKEGIDFQDRIEVLRKIALSSDGRAGVALKLLDQVLEVVDEARAIKIIERAVVTESTVIELCRLLNDSNVGTKAKWPKIQAAIKDLKTANDAESVRYAVLGYFTTVLLSGGWSMRTAKLLTYFSESFMYSGWAGFTAACFFINYGENGDDIPA
jgi:DNA polymerase III gamma/tau subunit